MIIQRVTVRERGATPGLLKRDFGRLAKEAWEHTGGQFHAKYAHKRFTPEHAREARYAKRKGEGLPRGSKGFKRSYYGRKISSQFGGGKGKANPLEWSGKAKRGSRIVNALGRKSGVKLKYKGVRVFNFRHPKSRIRMDDEFRRILPKEAEFIADTLDNRLDRNISNYFATKTTTIRG